MPTSLSYLTLLALSIACVFSPPSHAKTRTLPSVIHSTQCPSMVGKRTPFQLVLNPDEPLVTHILNCVNQAQLQGAWIFATGRIKAVELESPNSTSTLPQSKSFHSTYALLNLSGTFTLADKQPTLMLHATLGDDQLHTLGGHLLAATTVESTTIGITPWITKATPTRNQHPNGPTPS